MKTKSLWAIFLLSVLIHFANAADIDHPIVKTTKGSIRGIRLTSETGKPVDAFLGIPYAKPPIGKNRFKQPVPMDPWTNILDVKEKGNTCFHIIENSVILNDLGGSVLSTSLSEDCLQLNVWVPIPRPKKAAVMVWIHGGAFCAGSSTVDMFDMNVLVSEENIIGVSLNYRLSSLGFLYLGHSDAPGNAGLFDQALALQWVKENIAAFGGDPDMITIFGVSAGSSSVNFHLLSPISQGSFNRAILESGTANSIFSTLDKSVAIQNGVNLAKSVNCPSDLNHVESIIECLQKKDPKDLTKLSEMDLASLPFAPIVDGSMVKESPVSSIENHRFKNTNILIGSTKEEGSLFLLFEDPLFSIKKEVFLTRAKFIEFIKSVDPFKTSVSEEAIAFEYTHWANPEDGKENTDALGKIYGDLYFTCPTVNVAHAYAEAGNDVFHYEFSRLFAGSHSPKWIGVTHGAEFFYVFGKFLDKKFPVEESEFNKRLMRYWANFAKTGNPNTSPSGKNESIYWPPYTTSGREYLVLKDKFDKPHYALRAKKCAFWDKHLPRLVQLTGGRQETEGFCLIRCLKQNLGSVAVGIVIILGLKWLFRR